MEVAPNIEEVRSEAAALKPDVEEVQWEAVEVAPDVEDVCRDLSESGFTGLKD